MKRPLWSLLAMLLLVLASQAVAERDGDEGDRGKDDREAKDERENEGDDENQGDDEKEHAGDEDDDDREGNDRGGESRKDGDRGRWRHAKAESAESRESADLGGQGPVAGLAILPTALPGRVQFTFLVSASGASEDTTMVATIPDTGHPWTLSGPDASGCRLAGSQLRCAFRGLGAGDVQLIQAVSRIGQAPPWELVANGTITASGDRGMAAAGKAASAQIGLLLA